MNSTSVPYNPFTTLMWIGKFFGLFPPGIEKSVILLPQQQQLGFSRLRKFIYCLIMILLSVGSVCMGVHVTLTLVQVDMISRVMAIIMITTFSIKCLHTHLYFNYYSQSVIEFFQSWASLNRQITESGTQKSKWYVFLPVVFVFFSIFKAIAFSLVSFSAIAKCNVTLHGVQALYPGLNFIAYFCFMPITAFPSALFCCCAQSVIQSLSDLKTKMTCDDDSWCPTSSHLEKLVKVQTKISLIKAQVMLLQERLGFLLFTVIVQKTFNICFDLYAVIYLKNMIFWSTTVLLCAVVLVELLELLLTVLSADEITIKESEVIAHGFEIGRNIRTPHSRLQAYFTIQDMLNSSMEISASNFFVVNRKLITTTIGIVVTYTIILAQFKTDKD